MTNEQTQNVKWLLSDLVDLVMENDLAAEQISDLPYAGDDFNEASDRVNDVALELKIRLEYFFGKKLTRVLQDDIATKLA